MKLLLVIVLIPVGLLFLAALFLFVCGLFVDMKKEYERDSAFYRTVLNAYCIVCLWLLGIRFEIIGEEKFPSEGNFLFISNHRSNYDPIIQWTVFRHHKMSFISKKENFKIPFFGRIIHRCCFMPIDRENPRRAMETIIRAAKLLQETDNSVGVYPEGKRSKDCTLLPFHGGVLKAAKKAGKPVVISTIEGTENIFKNIKRFRKTIVTIKILETISAQRVTAEKTALLSEYCEELMKKELEGTK